MYFNNLVFDLVNCIVNKGVSIVNHFYIVTLKVNYPSCIILLWYLQKYILLVGVRI